MSWERLVQTWGQKCGGKSVKAVGFVVEALEFEHVCV